MASDIDICNLALMRAGVTKQVASMQDRSVEGMACAALYPLARDAALTSFSWPWATRRAGLQLLSGGTPPVEVPRSGWRYVYALPTDCLMPLYIWPGFPNPRPEERVPYTTELAKGGGSRVLLTDKDSAELVYVARVSAASVYPPAFVQALAWLVASELARALRKDEAVASRLYTQWQVALSQAAATALRESQSEPPPPPDFLKARE